MGKNESGKFTVLSVRANKALRTRLTRIARKENRTLSAQAFTFLEEAVERAERDETPTGNTPAGSRVIS